MNIQSNINKLLIALKQKNKLYKINNFKHWSDKQNNYVTNYQIMKREIIESIDIDTGETTKEYKYKKVEGNFSSLCVLMYLVSEYKEE